nr:hypothetical protein [Halobaculum sp. SYNS20]
MNARNVQRDSPVRGANAATRPPVSPTITESVAGAGSGATAKSAAVSTRQRSSPVAASNAYTSGSFRLEAYATPSATATP